MSLAQVMEIHKIGVIDLARRLDVSERTIYNWLNENKIPPKRIEQLTTIFGVDEEVITKELSYLEELEQAVYYYHLGYVVSERLLEKEKELARIM
jgi:plasmid maintenance system antidote protein VapI